jgi:hypothetical protein
MDKCISLGFELLRSGLGLAFLYQQDDWFGAVSYFSFINYILGAYFIASIAITGWFVIKHRKEDQGVLVKA